MQCNNDSPARRWVLSSTLGSAFLDHHPEPRAVLKWTMAEYAALLNDDGERPAFIYLASPAMTMVGTNVLFSALHDVQSMTFVLVPPFSLYQTWMKKASKSQLT